MPDRPARAAPSRRPRAALWVLVGALATGVVATVAGLLHEGPEEMTARERDETQRKIAELEADNARLKAQLLEKAMPELRGVPPPTAPSPDGPPSASLVDRVTDREVKIRAAAEQRARDARALAEAQVKAEDAAEAKRREEERSFLEDKARGGTMALLAELRKKWHPVDDLVGSPERFGALFERKDSGVRAKGFAQDSRAPIEDGLTIALGPGVHGWSFEGKTFPSDLLVDGSGMDETLVLLGRKISPPGEIRSLTFRDLTICAASDAVFDLQAPATIRLERCRVVGFDGGHGGSDLVSGSAAAFYATDSRIEAGFGGSPGSGEIFDVRGAFLARFEGCTIVGPWSFGIFGTMGGNQTCRYVRCRFENVAEHYRAQVDSPPGGVRLEACSFEFVALDAMPPKHRSLTEINAAWVVPGR